MVAVYYLDQGDMSLVGHNFTDFGYNTPILGYLGVDSSDIFGGHTTRVIVSRRTKTTVVYKRH